MKPPSFICYWIIQDDANVSIWLQVRRVSRGPAAECGGRLEVSVGKVEGFGCWLSDFTPSTPVFDKYSIPLHHSHPKKWAKNTWVLDTVQFLIRCSILVFFFKHPFLITPSFFFQILFWPPHASQPWWVGAGRSDPPNTQPRLTLIHHSLTGMEERNTENRKDGCYPSPAAVYCTVDQWSSPTFISKLQQSATWPLHKNCSSEPLRFLSLPKFSFSFAASVHSESQNTHPYVRTEHSRNTPYKTDPWNPLCFISDGSWISALGEICLFKVLYSFFHFHYNFPWSTSWLLRREIAHLCKLEWKFPGHCL